MHQFALIIAVWIPPVSINWCVCSLYSPVILWFDLKQTTTQMLSTVSGTEKMRSITD